MMQFMNKVPRIKLTVIIGFAVVGVAGLLGAFPGVEKVSGNITGPPASHTSAPGEGNCLACHIGFAENVGGTGNVVISNVPKQYTLNQPVLITVTVSRTNSVTFGFQITAVDSQGNGAGTFSITQNPATMQTITGSVGGRLRQYLEHTAVGTGGSGSRSWTFTWTAPGTDIGPVTFYAAGNGANDDGTPSGDQIYLTSKTSNPPQTAPDPTRFDFDGDSKADPSIFRPSLGQWWYLRSSDFGNRAYTFGTSTDTLVPADYTGDGKTDIAFFRPSSGEWFILRSEDDSFFAFPFGTNGDIPAPGDYDGDGKADAAVFRPSSATWFISNSSGGTTIQGFGITEDKPVVGDYDGDGKEDIAIYRPSVSQWWQLRSGGGVTAFQFGTTGDKTVTGDYTGDGKTDVAFFRPSTGFWFVLRSEDSSFYSVPFGNSTDIPAPGDYDGDGKADTAVFRPSDNNWYIQGSTSGFFQIGFGLAGDIPVPNAYVRP